LSATGEDYAIHHSARERTPMMFLGRIQPVSIASITFDVFPKVFFNSGILLSLKTEPKRPQKR
jgi:hypothetical protein